jgi:hypothetical protein
MGLLVNNIEYRDIYDVAIGLGCGNTVVQIPAQSAEEARAIGRHYEGIEHYVSSVTGIFFDWPGKDQLPSLTRDFFKKLRSKP